MATKPRGKPGPKPEPLPRAQTREEREKRNYLIYARFLAGQSEREIGQAVGLTGQRVHQILKQELGHASRHNKLLKEEAEALWMARQETLLRVTMPKAMAGDLKAVEVARRLLEPQGAEIRKSRAAIPPISDQELSEDIDPGSDLDELSRFRMSHRRRDEDTG